MKKHTVARTAIAPVSTPKTDASTIVTVWLRESSLEELDETVDVEGVEEEEEEDEEGNDDDVEVFEVDEVDELDRKLDVVLEELDITLEEIDVDPGRDVDRVGEA